MAEQNLELLSREELDAILAELHTARERDARDLGSAFRRRTNPRPTTLATRLPELRGATEAGLEDWAKRLASRHQRRILSELISWDEVEVPELCESLPETDLVLRFDTQPFHSQGFIVLSRTLAFGLLSFEFGGQQVQQTPPPDREYTGIEQRFMKRAFNDVLVSLKEYWQGLRSLEINPQGLESPIELATALRESVMLASAEISGLASIGRIRIGIPKAPFQAASENEGSVREHHPHLKASLAGVEIPVRVEIGTTQLSLSDIGGLEVGDELFLEPASSSGFVIHVGDVPKFIGTKGHVGGRLAIQVQNRVEMET